MHKSCGDCKYEDLTFLESLCRACVSVATKPCFEPKGDDRDVMDVLSLYPKAIRDEYTQVLGSIEPRMRPSNVRYGTSIKFATKTACLVPKIINVIFNEPATIVFWSDGTKTVVKAIEEPYDPEKGLAMAISKKHMGNNYEYYNTFKHWLKVYDKKVVSK